MSPWVSFLECQSCTWIPCMFHCCFMPLFDCTQCSSEHVAKLGGSWYSFAWNPPSVFFQTWTHIHSTIYLHTCLEEVVFERWRLMNFDFSEDFTSYRGLLGNGQPSPLQKLREEWSSKRPVCFFCVMWTNKNLKHTKETASIWTTHIFIFEVLQWLCNKTVST